MIFGVIGQAQIVVGAHVEHGVAVLHADMRLLRRGDFTFLLVQPGFADFLQRIRNVAGDRLCHGSVRSYQVKITLPQLPDFMISKPFSNSV